MEDKIAKLEEMILAVKKQSYEKSIIEFSIAAIKYADENFTSSKEDVLISVFYIRLLFISNTSRIRTKIMQSPIWIFWIKSISKHNIRKEIFYDEEFKKECISIQEKLGVIYNGR